MTNGRKEAGMVAREILPLYYEMHREGQDYGYAQICLTCRTAKKQWFEGCLDFKLRKPIY